MLTIKAEIKRSELKADGTFNVKLRFTFNRKVKRVSTSLFVAEKDITSSGEIKKSSPMRQEVENLVMAYRQECAKLQVDLNNYTLDQIVELLKYSNQQNQPIDFIQFSESWVARATIKGKDNYTTAINSFKKFINKDHLDINLITVDLINRYMAYLNKVRQEKVKKLVSEGKRVPSNRSVSLYMMSIQHLYKEAMLFYNRPDLNIIRIESNPFQFIKIPKQEATRKRALQAEIIRKINALEYQTVYKGTKHTNRFNLAKDLFIMSFCLIGMNSVDIYNSQAEIKGGKLIYNRAKTTERRIDGAKMIINIPQMILPLMDKYKDRTGKRLFTFYKDYRDHKAFNKAINKGLKQIGDELEIEDLEFYAARHSWATIALNKCKIDKYTVHAALNHVDPSMRVTDIYIERDFVAENEANQKVLEYVFGK